MVSGTTSDESDTPPDESDTAPDGGTTVVADETVVEPRTDITARVVLSGAAGGLAGTVAMAPLLVGVPWLLGVFRPEPVVEFAATAASYGSVILLEPSLVVGAAMFALAGSTVIPLFFLVAGAFLPPREPRNRRGVTFATFLWTGFLLAFWPGTSLATNLVFVVVSLLGHWVYGYVLGTVVDRTTGIPQHDV